MRWAIAIAVLLAGGTKAPCQNTFISQMDAVQAGRDAYGNSVMETDSGYLVFGLQVSADGTGRTRCMVYQLNGLGEHISHYEIGTGEPHHSSYGAFDPVTRKSGGGYAAAIHHHGGYDGFVDLVTFDEAGDTLSSVHAIVCEPSDSVLLGTRQLRQTADGGFVFCGFHDETDSYPKALLVKLDSTGTVQWQQTYDATGQSHEAISVAPYVDGGYVLAGYRLPQGLNGLGFLIRTDSVGNELWRRYFGDRSGGWCPVRVCGDGGIVVLSSYAETGWPFGWYQQLLVKYDGDGGLVWQTRCNYYANVTAFDMEVLPDQSIIGVGTYSMVIGLTKYTASGDSAWCRLLHVFDNLDLHETYDVELTSDGGFLLTGQASQGIGDPHPGQETIFVIKTDSLGCVIPGCQNVGVQEYAIDLQEHLAVSPNPASEQVNVVLALPETGELEGSALVLLQDASGRTVLEQPVLRNLNQLRATVDVSALPAGLYYLHLRDQKRWLAGSKVIVE